MILTTLLLPNSILTDLTIYDKPMINQVQKGNQQYVERSKSNNNTSPKIKKKAKISLYVCILFIQLNRQERDDLPTMRFDAFASRRLESEVRYNYRVFYTISQFLSFNNTLGTLKRKD